MRRALGLAALLVTACAPSGGGPTTAPPSPPDPSASPIDVATPQPAPTTPSPADATPDPTLTPASEAGESATTLPPACDQYLALYETCEPKLQPEIDAGDRRTFKVEKASLEYTAGTPEGAGLPEACPAMLDELKPVCL